MQAVARALAHAFLAGVWEETALIERASIALGNSPRWLRPLVRRVIKGFPLPPTARLSELARLIFDSGVLQREVAKRRRIPRIVRFFAPLSCMERVPGPPGSFQVPRLHSSGELAQWLQLPVQELDWFADVCRYNEDSRTPAKARHYHHRWIKKSSGGYRLIEAPKRRLRDLQRRLLHEILAAYPPAPDAHGFVRGRSVHSFVAPHVGKYLVVRLDLEDFFSSVSCARVRSMFQRVGYPESVAAKLAGLCTVGTPNDTLMAMPFGESDNVHERFQTRQRLRQVHLPQGAPTSPMLSNLAAFALDRRLFGVAKSLGAVYSRYADDLAFSGGRGLERSVPWFLGMVGAIAEEEGFRVRHRKTRVMQRSRRQELAGLVVNEHSTVRRCEYDRLRALLHNAARFGPESQNRKEHPRFREHLAGKISWVMSTHPVRGKKLTELFERIHW